MSLVANKIIAIIPTADYTSVCGCHCVALQSMIIIDSMHPFLACSHSVSIIVGIGRLVWRKSRGRLLFSQEQMQM